MDSNRIDFAPSLKIEENAFPRILEVSQRILNLEFLNNLEESSENLEESRRIFKESRRISENIFDESENLRSISKNLESRIFE